MPRSIDIQDSKALFLGSFLLYVAGAFSILMNVAVVDRENLTWLLYVSALFFFFAGFALSAIYEFNSKPTLLTKIGQAFFAIIVAIALVTTTIYIDGTSDLIKALQALAGLAAFANGCMILILAIVGEVEIKIITRTR